MHIYETILHYLSAMMWFLWPNIWLTILYLLHKHMWNWYRTPNDLPNDDYHRKLCLLLVCGKRSHTHRWLIRQFFKIPCLSWKNNSTFKEKMGELFWMNSQSRSCHPFLVSSSVFLSKSQKDRMSLFLVPIRLGTFESLPLTLALALLMVIIMRWW